MVADPSTIEDARGERKSSTPLERTLSRRRTEGAGLSLGRRPSESAPSRQPGVADARWMERLLGDRELTARSCAGFRRMHSLEDLSLIHI